MTSSPVDMLPTAALPAEYGTSYLGCVSQANFRDFFGPTFASRAAISSRIDLDVNQLCLSDVQLTLGVSSPVAAEIVRAREKARIHSASELLALVSDPKVKQRVSSVCRRGVLKFEEEERDEHNEEGDLEEARAAEEEEQEEEDEAGDSKKLYSSRTYLLLLGLSV